MAIFPDVVERLVVTLNKLGFTVDAKHAKGQPDAAFMTAYQNAIKVVQTVAADGDKSAVVQNMSPQQFEALKTKLLDKEAHPEKLDAIRAIAEKRDFVDDNGTHSWMTVKAMLVTPKYGFTWHMLDDAGYLADTLAHPGALIADIQAVEKYKDEQQAGPKLWAAAAPPATQTPPPPATQTPPPPPPPQQMQPDPAVQQAADEAKRAEMRKKVVTALQTGYLDMPNGTGVYDAQTDAKLIEKIKEMQTNAKAAGYKGEVDGVYSQRFDTWLASQPGEFSSFALTMERFVGTGLQVGSQVQAAPPQAGAAAPASAGTGAATTPPAASPAAAQPAPGAPLPPLDSEPVEPEAASIMLEKFLTEVGTAMNVKIATVKEKGGLFGGLLLQANEIPLPTGTPDGKFDDDLKKSLQSVLKAFQVQLELSDDEIINYNADVGEKIRRNFPKIAKTLKPEQKKALDSVGGGIDYMVRCMNSLNGAGQLSHEKLFDDNTGIKLSGMGASILQWIMGFVTKLFPGAKPLMDGLVRSFTGGLGLNDLMPANKQDSSLPTGVSGNIPTAESLTKQYADALTAAKTAAGPNAKPEEVQAKLNETLKNAMNAMKIFPIGDEASRAAYDNAFNQGLIASQAQGDDNAKGIAFAQTFLANYNVDMARDPLTGAPKVMPQGTAPLAADPTVYAFKVGAANYNEIFDVYKKLAGYESRAHDLQKPMVFTRPEDGTTWVAGMDDNRFTIQQITPEAVVLLDQAIAQGGGPDATAALLKKIETGDENKGVHLMVGGYGKYMNLQDLRAEITNVQSFEQTKGLIEMRVGNQIGQQTQDTIRLRNQEVQRARRNELFGDPAEHPGVDQERLSREIERDNRSRGSSARQANTQARETDSVLTARTAATKTPQLIRSEFEKGQRREIVLLTYDDPTGYAIQATRSVRAADDDGPLQYKEFFGQHSVDKDFWQFRKDLAAYVASRGEDLKGLSPHAQVLEFEKFKGKTFETRYPDLAMVSHLPGYRGTQFDGNIRELYEHVNKQITQYAGAGTSPSIRSIEPSTNSYARSEELGRTSRPAATANHMKPTLEGSGLPDIWRKLGAHFKRHADPDEEQVRPRYQDSDRPDRGADREGGSADTRLDPKRPVADPPKDPNAYDPAPSAASIFPGADASQSGSARPQPGEFGENHDHVTQRITPESTEPDELFPGARNAPTGPAGTNQPGRQ